MRKLLTGIFFTLAILVFAQIAQANTFVECEYGNSDACTAKYGAGIQGHWTYDSHNADGSWTCISDLGQFYCDKPYWGQCAGAFIGNPPKSPGVCWAGLSGSKPPVPASQLLYGPVHPREGTSACSGQAPGDMPSSADLYCVCGVGDAAACPTPTTPPPTPTNTPNPTPHPTTSPTPQPTPTPILTTGNLALQVQGIGLNDVLNPLHPIRRVILYFYPPTDTSFQ
ncbi:MAG: hypothetical protein KGL95_10435, partial [Patescibacteria group bacterium]|nr:hypothetical protein [Patescibacteria group bacterium]